MDLNFFINRREYLVEKIAKLEKRIEKYPDMMLSASKEGSFSKWYVYSDSNYKDRRYLPKKQRRLASMLARKKLDLLYLNDLKNELESIDFYLRHRKKVNWENLLAKDSAYRELLVKIDDWEYQPYEKKTDYPEDLTVPAPKGDMVRSKSEAIIAYALFEKGIPYHYEEVHHFGKIKMGADFTIRHPQTGKDYIWEHFGMAEKSDYQSDINFKMPTYLNAGYIPGINLITTYETKNDHIDIAKVYQIIEETFC